MADILALHTDQASLVFENDAERGLLWRHCGVRVNADDLPADADGRGLATFALDTDIAVPVMPSRALGWFGPPLVELADGEGRVVEFAATSCTAHLSDSALRAEFRDEVAGVAVSLEITTVAGGAFRFRTSLTNEGDRPISVARLASLHLPLPAQSREIVSWRGRHIAELAECREPLPQQRWERATREGVSGHGGPPGLYVLGEGCTWHSGLAIAAQLAWSGDSTLAVERQIEGTHTLVAETNAMAGEIRLEPGESWQAPDAFLAISTHGRNGAMAQQHAAVRTLLAWPGDAMSPRPVHLNSWEACYFNHDAERMKGLAEAGASIGIERFVLDDGWFKGRRNDRAGLGDWEPDSETYPDGLGPLAREVEGLGMQFGLWVEPEMVNPDSDLYRAHPDWALASEGRPRPTARNQLVLDMRREDVRDYLFERLDTILRSAPISYLKWDQNRAHAPSGGAGQTLGTYRLLERLRAAHPHVEIEGCAAGGGRSDAGMARYVHRFWTSDNIDAVSRIAMQRGFLAFLPPEIMGSHVGASPAHATGRSHPLAFRAAIACMGHLGVELDPERLPEEDRAELARWIAFYKQWRDLLHAGRVDLGEGPDGLRWQAQGTEDHKLLFCIRTEPASDKRPRPLCLPFAIDADHWDVGLLEIAQQPGFSWPQAAIFDRMREDTVRYSGSWLAEAGLPMPLQKAESVAIFELRRSAA
ncbi:alpha-galactosidase [Erythrobacter sp. HKB08]|uniref:alpha-galactosidase n=1 Tax=Erythrobacter sp. HKB08 TaxID=2502843 RepID=UPI001008BC7D|nr:alpha-galactosidase [Erythrobacter sp. HKB08]